MHNAPNKKNTRIKAIIVNTVELFKPTRKSSELLGTFISNLTEHKRAATKKKICAVTQNS